MNYRRIAFLLLSFLFLIPALAAEPLKVMSFNVRYPNSRDGENAWEARRDVLVETIRRAEPDVLGTQELFQLQADYIIAKLPQYGWFGLSRYGNHENEHMGIFYRKDLLQLLESGNFWLSQTPDTPGGMSWNVNLPRMVTWGLFRTKSGRQFYFYNTHFPHRDEDDTARQECARLIAMRIEKLAKNIPLILTGDFNSDEGSVPYGILVKDLQDARKTATSQVGPTGTTHGFRGKPGSHRIDWILYRGPWNVETFETSTYNQEGRFPSDHFPVIAHLAWPSPSK